MREREGVPSSLAPQHLLNEMLEELRAPKQRKYFPPFYRTLVAGVLPRQEILERSGIDVDRPMAPEALELNNIVIPEFSIEEPIMAEKVVVPQAAVAEPKQIISIPEYVPELHVQSMTTVEDMESRLVKLKAEKLKLLQSKFEDQDGLPHRYGRKWFKWQRDFFESTAKDYLLTAANQVGKSTIGASTAIEWCCNKKLWPKLWPGKIPRQIWYLYPSSDFAGSEIKTKWVTDLLPRGKMMTDPDWGWRLEYSGRSISAIHFNSGCSLYFKFYTQDIMNLQGSTVAAIFCDEELVEHFWPELNQRRMFYNGYFRMFFTATLGQKIWFDAMEMQGRAEEFLPDATKVQVSLYDCKVYEDGSPSHITDEYIARAINLCKSEAEIQKRVMGRFAVEGGLKYSSFDRKSNVIDKFMIPKTWVYYVGVDIGSGRDPTAPASDYQGHPSSIQFVAVDPEYSKAVCFDAWLGDDELTVDLDVYEKLLTMLQKHDAFDRLGGIFYDYHAKDFGIICQRKGLSVLKAEKSHEIGESVINVLFKNKRLSILNLPQHEELIFELTNLKRSTAKRAARDDAIDALRYALTRIPFDWQKIGVEGVSQNLRSQMFDPPKLPTREELLTKERRAGLHNKEQPLSIEQEMDAWNELYDY